MPLTTAQALSHTNWLPFSYYLVPGRLHAPPIAAPVKKVPGARAICQLEISSEAREFLREHHPQGIKQYHPRTAVKAFRKQTLLL